ncbi:uncharacterized protein PSFLO_00492 [Pseudozyma flocculosa]|uniref:Peptidase S33 tripeptidyl aminopeptidase-like C-terminal domain-containing protein n=2 Tax=Pseudozyma flocculosa TaxID=84751 RepID=A0A5C3EVB4_9BASI|nr:uncharacterized protein PSFLO_00492 [Pseudozyma flocculosa]
MDHEKRRQQAGYDAIDLPPPGTHAAPRSGAKASWRFLVAALLCFTLLTWQSDRVCKHDGNHHSHHGGALKPEDQTDFTKSARGEIDWYDCGDKDKFPHPFQCGRLKTPLDYTNPSDERNASIAVVFWPAGAGKTPKHDILGSILTNPGGPGGSGVDFLTRKPKGKRTSLGDLYDRVMRRRYNIVSFDPRGIERSYPTVDCYNSTRNSHLSQLQMSTLGVAGARPNSLESEYGAQISRGEFGYKLCASDPVRKELLRHVSTAAVSRDMQLLHRALGDDKINYWGFSYGTVLGSTYADMFPDDVNRLIIDGVVDVPNYYAGLWSDAFVDIDAEFDAFFDECARAGAEACKLASHGGDGKQLRQKYLAKLDELKLHPMPAFDAKHPQLLTYSQVFSAMFHSLYVPARWPELTSLLDQILRGNPSPFVDVYGDQPYNASSAPRTPWAQDAIAAGDVVHPPANHTWSIDEYAEWLRSTLSDSSEMFAPMFGQIALSGLVTWKTRSVDRHFGNFTSTTSFPLLMLGNDFDPVTPGRNADLMASKFPRAVAVHRSGYGHCSLSMPSRCIDKVVRDYFVHGIVPEKGTRCETDQDKPIFPLPGKEREVRAKSSRPEDEDEEEEALKALQDIGAAVAEVNMRHGRVAGR